MATAAVSQGWSWLSTTELMGTGNRAGERPRKPSDMTQPEAKRGQEQSETRAVASGTSPVHEALREKEQLGDEVFPKLPTL